MYYANGAPPRQTIEPLDSGVLVSTPAHTGRDTVVVDFKFDMLRWFRPWIFLLPKPFYLGLCRLLKFVMQRKLIHILAPLFRPVCVIWVPWCQISLEPSPIHLRWGFSWGGVSGHSHCISPCIFNRFSSRNSWTTSRRWGSLKVGQ